MANNNSLQRSPINSNGGSLNNSLDNSQTSIRSFYSTPNTSSPPKKTFVIKSKATATSHFYNAKIQSSTSIPELLVMKPLFIPVKTLMYRKLPMYLERCEFREKKGIHSMQDIPLNISMSQSISPKKKNTMMARLKPLNKHTETKKKKNQELLENLLKNVDQDEIDEEQILKKPEFSDSVEETKAEEEFSPMIMKKSLKESILPSDVFNLINHNFKDENLQGFFEKLDPYIKRIYLSNNDFGMLSCHKLFEILKRPNFEPKLIELDLEECKISDQVAMNIFMNLHRINNLRILNLTGNFISHLSCSELKSLLASNTSIRELYLRKNKLSGLAGISIFQGLLMNSTLKVLDLSWNILTMKACADALVKVLKQDICGLIHLDLSYNNFSVKEAQIISEGLFMNHQLYGLHFEGNFGYIDAKGCLIVPNNCRKKNLGDYDNSRRIKGLKSYHLQNLQASKCEESNEEEDEDEEEIKYKNCCWLCDNWREIVFELSLDELSDLPPVERVFIHLEVEGFQALPMNKPNNKASKYVYRKVLPASRVMFFFTVNELQLTSERFFTVKNPTPVLKNIKIGEMISPEIELRDLNYIEAGEDKIQR